MAPLKVPIRPRWLVAGTLLTLGLAAAVLTALQKLDLHGGESLTILLTVLSAVTAFADSQMRDRARGDEATRQRDREDQGLARRAEAARQDLLAEVRRIWAQPDVDARPDGLTHIELRLVERPDLVRSARPAVADVDRPRERGSDVAAVFQRAGHRLLVLGGPGAGKTTLLIELTRALLDAAENGPSEPMPVVFSLSAWAADRRPLVDWMVEELLRSYGVSHRLGRLWVDTDQVIPILDGLDEVPGRYRDACVAAINEFRVEHGQLPIVISSRTDEYEALRERLELRGAIEVQPLTPADVDRHLREAGPALAGLRTILRRDGQLRELLTVPLLLRFAMVTYPGRSAATLGSAGSAEERRRQVLGDYLERQLQQAAGGQARWSREDTISWLGWLARAMRVHDQSLFHLDWLQPDWLPNRRQRWAATTGVAVAIGLAVAAGLTPILFSAFIAGMWLAALGLGVWALVAMGPWTPLRLAVAAAGGLVGGLLLPPRLQGNLLDLLGGVVFRDVSMSIVVIGLLPFILVCLVALIAWAAGRALGAGVRPVVVLAAAVLIGTQTAAGTAWNGPVVAAAVGISVWVAAGIEGGRLARVLVALTAGAAVGLVARLALPDLALAWAASALVAGVAAGMARPWVIALGAGPAIRTITAFAAGGVAYLLLGQILLWDFVRLLVEGEHGGIVSVVLPLVAAVVVGLSAYGPAVTPTSRLRWSWTSLGRRLPGGLARAAGAGTAVGLAGGLIAIIASFSLGGPMVLDLALLAQLLLFEAGAAAIGLLVGLAWGAAVAAASGLDAGLVVTPIAPGQGIRGGARDAAVAGLVSLLVAVPAGLAVAYAFGAMRGLLEPRLPASLWDPLSTALLFFRPGGNLLLAIAVVVPLIVALRLGGATYVRHHAIRTLLAAAGSAPADYPAFLDNATRLVLLRRRGGGYEFLHRLLLEHLAAREPGAALPATARRPLRTLVAPLVGGAGAFVILLTAVAPSLGLIHDRADRRAIALLAADALYLLTLVPVAVVVAAPTLRRAGAGRAQARAGMALSLGSAALILLLLVGVARTLTVPRAVVFETYSPPTHAAGLSGIAAGHDGNLWFVEGLGSKIGRIDATGAVTEFTTPDTSSTNPASITAGADGDLWFTIPDDNKIGRITTEGTITEFVVPTAYGYPTGVAAGPDGNIWFTEHDGDKIGRATPTGAMTEFAVPTANAHPSGIAAGPDGNLWFTEYDGDRIGRISPAGVITEIALASSSRPAAIAAGPDGNLWFADGDLIGRISPAGAVSEFPLPQGSGPASIAPGPDRSLWFTESGAGRIGRIATTGAISTFNLPSSASQPEGIVAGPDGYVWFTEGRDDKIGRISTAGALAEFDLSIADSPMAGVATGTDGSLWFTEPGTRRVGRVTPAGAITELLLPGRPEGVASTPDGNIWFTEPDAYRIGRISPAGEITEFPVSSPPEGIAAGRDGSLWFTEPRANRIGQVSPSGAIAEVSLTTDRGGPQAIAAGPDGSVWFTEPAAGAIGRIGPTGQIAQIAQIAQSNVHSRPGGIAVGRDGDGWFTEPDAGRIGRITPAGQVVEYPINTVLGLTAAGLDSLTNVRPQDIAAGPDGNLWFTELSANGIGRISPTGEVIEFSLPRASLRIAADPAGRIWFTDSASGQIGLIKTRFSSGT